MNQTVPLPTGKILAEMPNAAPATPAHSSLAERLAQVLSSAATARAVYGEAVTQGGTTVVPVARARYGFGGGSGARADALSGSGGGGGVSITPMGFIELKDGRSRFRPIRRSAVPLVAVSGLVALLLLRSIPKLLPRR